MALATEESAKLETSNVVERERYGRRYVVGWGIVALSKEG